MWPAHDSAWALLGRAAAPGGAVLDEVEDGDDPQAANSAATSSIPAAATPRRTGDFVAQGGRATRPAPATHG